MVTAGLQIDSTHPTGTVEVHIENDEPSFDIVRDRAYDFIEADTLPPLSRTPLLYHGSLALRNEGNRRALERIREQSRAPAFLDVNLRPPWWERDAVLALLHAARWAKVNEHELEHLAPSGTDPLSRAQALQEGCDLALVIVTLGAEGAMARCRDGTVVQVAPEPTIRLVDTVGAGDAFSSVTLLGLLRDWDLRTTLQRAQSFASAVVGIRGATPDSQEFYTPFLTDWT